MALVKVCDKCGKINIDKRYVPGETCKYCQGKMIIRGEQNTQKLGWKEAQK